jgi:Mitochondrial branched-chain alpha-ketoacid dehydrogenase kinase
MMTTIVFPPSTRLNYCRRILVRRQLLVQQQQQQQQVLHVSNYRSISSTSSLLQHHHHQQPSRQQQSLNVRSLEPNTVSTRSLGTTTDIQEIITTTKSTLITPQSQQRIIQQPKEIQQLYRYYSTSPLVVNDSILQNKITELAKEPQTSVSLNALMKTGRGEFLHKTFGTQLQQVVEPNTTAATELVLIQVAGFLRRELPIRMAHRIQDLEGIPVLRDMDSVKLVRDMYIKSIQDIISYDTPITTPEQEKDFSKIIEKIYERHSSVLVQMARGAYEFRQAVRANASTNNKGDEFELQSETHAFLDRFYLCRIGIRVLIGQYLALRQPPVDNYIGIICSHTSSYEIVKRAIDDAAFMCTRIYGDSPEVIMSGRLDLSFPYVPTHLRT